VELPERRYLRRYRTVPADLRPYLGTWGEGAFDLGDAVVETDDGFFEARDASSGPRRIEPDPDAYAGRVLLLVGAANSSATFYLAEMAKRGGIATLVGQPTGGNRRGVNGSQMFFLTLPNSRIEMDIPLVATFPLSEQPDAGVTPDVLVEPAVEDVIAGVDAELEAALGVLRGG
jgi:C-terminal processing protease CtpA/Prc